MWSPNDTAERVGHTGISFVHRYYIGPAVWFSNNGQLSRKSTNVQNTTKQRRQCSVFLYYLPKAPYFCTFCHCSVFLYRLPKAPCFCTFCHCSVFLYRLPMFCILYYQSTLCISVLYAHALYSVLDASALHFCTVCQCSELSRICRCSIFLHCLPVLCIL